jgi:uncharacterized protein YjiS (DUF1127 family)
MNLMKLPGEMYNRMKTNSRNKQDLQTLYAMTDYELADIGLTRGTIKDAFYKGKK